MVRKMNGTLMRSDDQLLARRNSLKQVETYEVVRSEFDSIEREGANIGTAFAFATACIPVAITITVTLATVSISGASTRITFLLLMGICYILGAYFAVCAYRRRGNLKRFMKGIRDSQVPPIASKELLHGPRARHMARKITKPLVDVRPHISHH
jgi:hypothetical protein